MWQARTARTRAKKPSTANAARPGRAWLGPRSSTPPGPCSSNAATGPRRSRPSARLSDVPPATVYRLFSSKRGILKALLDVSIVGDDEAAPLAGRPHVRSLFADPDPKHQLAGFVGIAAEVNSRTAPVYRILVSAASSDPDAAALLDELTRQRQDGQGLIARSLASRRRVAARATTARCRRRHPRAHVPRDLRAARHRQRLGTRAL